LNRKSHVFRLFGRDWHKPICQKCQKKGKFTSKIGRRPEKIEKKSQKYAQSTPFLDRSLIPQKSRENIEKLAQKILFSISCFTGACSHGSHSLIMARCQGTGKGRNISGLRNQHHTSQVSHQQPTVCVLPDDSKAEDTRLASDLSDTSDGESELEDDHTDKTEWEDLEDEKLKTWLEAMEAKLDAEDKDWLLPKEAWTKRKRDEAGRQGAHSYLFA
jgi:hypothetical protein